LFFLLIVIDKQQSEMIGATGVVGVATEGRQATWWLLYLLIIIEEQ
jgi:hypothetical protein